MVDRKPKLVAAGVVLTVGVGLAMLFRRSEPQAAVPTASESPLAAAITSSSPPVTPVSPDVSLSAGVTPTPLDGQRSPQPAVPATNVGLAASVGLPASMPPLPTPITPLPTAAATTAPASDALPTLDAPAASGGRPVYATGLYDDADQEGTAPASYRIHVVHEGDSLERIAERYLTDGGRSLELFDLNRDVLDNPHLLPIGAELKIPVEADQSAD